MYICNRVRDRVGVYVNHVLHGIFLQTVRNVIMIIFPVSYELDVSVCVNIYH